MSQQVSNGGARRAGRISETDHTIGSGQQGGVGGDELRD